MDKLSGPENTTETAEVVIAPSESEEQDEVSGPTQYDLLTYPADFTLEVLYSKWKAGEIIIPPFQRKFVWTQPQASRLIESFLLGLPVPPIFLYAKLGTEQLLVVDGQQRLMSVFYFFEGNFGEERGGKTTVFRLQLGKESRWDTLKYSDLAEDDARRLKNSVLRAYFMRQVKPEDDTSIYYVFERLNTGGTLLRPQEVRNGVYAGPFNNMLYDLNTLVSWRKILGTETPDARLRDVEMILRFFALYESGDAYRTPMKKFLTDFMAKHQYERNTTPYAKVFTQVSDEVLETLGPKPFHLRAGLVQAAFDAVFLAFAKRKGPIPRDIGKRFKALTADSDFNQLTQRATTDVDRVKSRISLAQQYLFRV